MKEKLKMTRRDILKQGLGLTASALVGSEAGLRYKDFKLWLRERNERMRFDRFHDLSPKERECIITKEVEHVGAFIRSAEGKRILESGTDDEINKLLTSLPPILREHIKDTKYDIRMENWPSVIVDTGNFGLNPSIKALDSAFRMNQFITSYGNGFYVDNETVLTNVHVLNDSISELSNTLKSKTPSEANTHVQQMINNIQEQYKQQNIDVVALNLTRQSADRMHAKVNPIDPIITNNDVHGRFITTAGIDNDDSSDTDGTKLYPSIAVQVTPRLYEFLSNQWGGAILPSTAKSFLCIHPPSEYITEMEVSPSGSRLLDTLITRKFPKTQSHVLAIGMSGSPVLMTGQVVGIHHSNGTLPLSNGTCLDVGFFHGPDEIRTALQSGMIYDTDALAAEQKREQMNATKN